MTLHDYTVVAHLRIYAGASSAKTVEIFVTDKTTNPFKVRTTPTELYRAVESVINLLFNDAYLLDFEVVSISDIVTGMEKRL